MVSRILSLIYTVCQSKGEANIRGVREHRSWLPSEAMFCASPKEHVHIQKSIMSECCCSAMDHSSFFMVVYLSSRFYFALPQRSLSPPANFHAGLNKKSSSRRSRVLSTCCNFSRRRASRFSSPSLPSSSPARDACMN